ncbi:MAG: hypothetical protein U9N54_04960 [candidate division Zixibacteria bacterium]|nr:hypothetical protein [candidate division Zixibacteria bacterium]
MKKIMLFGFAVLLTATNANAVNFAVITSPPIFLNVFILILAFGCILGALSIYKLVKGGNLSKSWQLFVFGFVVLTISQLGYLAQAFEILTLPIFIIPALMVITFGLFLYGIIETKKILG